MDPIPEQAKAAPTNDRLHLSIEGMSCGSCAAGIERALASAPGVRSASVSFAVEEAVVDFDPTQTDSQQLSRVVE